MAASAEKMTLANTAGDSVQLSYEDAKAAFTILTSAEATLQQAQADFGENGSGEAPPVEEDEQVKIDTFTCSKKVLEVVKEYAELPATKRTKQVNKPVKGDYGAYVNAHELRMVRDAERDDYLVDLLDVAITLGFAALRDVCAGYCSLRIREIAMAAPDIMEGAERIRKFLHMENEWTDEEMVHLRKEMEMLKSLDSSIY